MGLAGPELSIDANERETDLQPRLQHACPRAGELVPSSGAERGFGSRLHAEGQACCHAVFQAWSGADQSMSWPLLSGKRQRQANQPAAYDMISLLEQRHSACVEYCSQMGFCSRHLQPDHSDLHMGQHISYLKQMRSTPQDSA